MTLVQKVATNIKLQQLNKYLKAQSKGLSLTVARYLKEEKFSPKPSIRVSVNVTLDDAEIELLANTLEQALKVIGL